MGLYTVNARAFAEGFYYFLSFVAGTYFLYLYFFAGLTKEEKKNVILLGLLFVGAAAFWSGFDQSASSLSIFARDYTDLSVSGYVIPIGWLQFANPIFVVIFAPIFAGMWTHLARKNLNPSLPIKFAFGLLLMALSFVVMLYAVELALVSSPVNMRWLISQRILTGDETSANSTAYNMTTKLSAIKRSPKANLIGSEGLRFLRARCVHIPAKIGAKITTKIGFANCNQPIGMT